MVALKKKLLIRVKAQFSDLFSKTNVVLKAAMMNPVTACLAKLWGKYGLTDEIKESIWDNITMEVFKCMKDVEAFNQSKKQASGSSSFKYKDPKSTITQVKVNVKLYRDFCRDNFKALQKERLNQPRAYERGRPMLPAAALKPSAAAATSANSAARRQQQRPTPPSETQAREQTRVQCGSPAPEARPQSPGAARAQRGAEAAGGSGGGAQGYDIDAALSSLLRDWAYA
eukprot:m51a1_g10883 hypothetical protein (228) ;mRNA; r:8057-23617